MATATRSLDVNVAFLREIKDDNRELQGLLVALRVLTTYPDAVREPPRRLVALLAQLRDQLAFHFALEEAYGYFEDAIDAAPWLSRRAERLRAQHVSLFESIRDLADQADRWQVGDGFLRRFPFLAESFRQFDATFTQHERAENALIHESSIEADIGVGD